jgi:hypothetical protein
MLLTDTDRPVVSRAARPVRHHYVTKELIVDSIVNGTTVTALCGHRYVVSSDPVTAGLGGRQNVCGGCQDAYEALTPG